MIKVSSDILGHEISLVTEIPIDSERFKGKLVSYILKNDSTTVVAKQFVKHDEEKETFNVGDWIIFMGHLKENRWKDKKTGEWHSEGQQIILDQVEKVDAPPVPIKEVQ